MDKRRVLELFESNKGWLRSKDFNYQPPVYAVLDEMLSAGEIEMVKKGLYRHVEINHYDSREELAILYPKGVFCLFSAWHYYDLSTTVPHQQHMAFPHKAQPQLLHYPPMKPYFWSEGQYELGQVYIDGLRIYDLEKSVCDAVKFRNKVGEEMTYEVTKNYMQSRKRNIEKLMTYAAQMRMTKIMSPILKAML
jgi:predicted transcriptional regulator of viral defense system